MGANDVVGDLALFIAVDDDFMPNIFNMIQHEVGVRRNNRLAIRRRRNIQRNENYFERVVPRFNDDLFKEHFRMSRASFQALVTLIGNMIEGNRDRLFNLAKKVQVAIWILSKQESFLAVGDRFGIPRSTCHCAFKEMIQTFKRLVPIYITWPNERILLDNARAFQLKSNGFPGIVAAVDGCHIQCRQPPGNANDFYNRKGNHSIILQGICDHRTKFLDIFVGLPGRIHDAQVLRRSPIYASLVNRNNPLLPPHLHLIGDSAYPLLINLMTPFRDTGHLTRQQINYNIKLSSVRSVIERAYGFLKNKFRRLKYLDVQSLQLGCDMVAAACMLHNFLILRGEIICDEIEFRDYADDNANEINNEDILVPAAIKRNNIVELLM